MLMPPDGVDNHRLLEMLCEQYGARGHTLTFMPLGEDSWSYRFGDLWVSLRRDLRGHVPEAYVTAARLLHGGLSFVLAPAVGRDGDVVHQVGDYPVVVFPYVEATPLSESADLDLSGVVSMLSAVHAVDADANLPIEDYTLSFEDDLDRALELASGPVPDVGPYSARIHRLLGHHKDRITSWRREIGALASACARDQEKLVITHGEPSAANILRHRGGLLLADWGGSMCGPPERDWFHVWRTLGVLPRCRDDFMRYYELKWFLSEVAEYSAHFRCSHSGTKEDEAMWSRLLRYLPEPV